MPVQTPPPYHLAQLVAKAMDAGVDVRMLGPAKAPQEQPDPAVDRPADPVRRPIRSDDQDEERRDDEEDDPADDAEEARPGVRAVTAAGDRDEDECEQGQRE